MYLYNLLDLLLLFETVGALTILKRFLKVFFCGMCSLVLIIYIFQQIYNYIAGVLLRPLLAKAKCPRKYSIESNRLIGTGYPTYL